MSASHFSPRFDLSSRQVLSRTRDRTLKDCESERVRETVSERERESERDQSLLLASLPVRHDSLMVAHSRPPGGGQMGSRRHLRTVLEGTGRQEGRESFKDVRDSLATFKRCLDSDD